MFRALLFFFLIPIHFGFGQLDQQYQLLIKRAENSIDLDGILDEPDWQNADVAKDFFQQFPYDTSFSLSKTEVRMTYDDNFVYVGATCYDEVPGEFIVQSLKRDFSFPRTDAFAIALDPYNDGTNGFSFGNNPYGAQREGTLEEGGTWGVSTAWDNKWYSKTKISTGFWTVEMAIPFSTIRFNEGDTEWHVNFARNDQKRNETSTWVPVGRNFNIANLAFTGLLKFDAPLKKSGTNISVIPYISGGASVDRQNGNGAEGNFNIGTDAKIGVTSALNLDLTFNPDFSQVDVDRQVTNLERFELFFPEKRQFFLENNDLFGAFGNSEVRTFFSRRIGLARDTSTGQLDQIPIIYGARLSGKLDQNWRLGLMNMQTAKSEALGALGQNYTVAALQRRIGARSRIQGIFVNRQAFGSDSGDVTGFNPNNYNRNAGIEYILASKDAKWDGSLTLHHAFDPDGEGGKEFHGSWLRYSTAKLVWEIGHEFVGENYQVDMGFVRRTNYLKFYPNIHYLWYPKSKWIRAHGPSTTYVFMFDNTSGKHIEGLYDFTYRVRFQSRAEFNVYLANNNITLRSPFDPSRSGALELPADTSFSFDFIGAWFTANERNNFWYSIWAESGNYFNGKKTAFEVEARYRIAPIANFSAVLGVNEIILPEPYGRSKPVVFGPKFEFAFKTNLFFTTYLQYNSQFDNVNLNARFQWRFKPVSDLFIVYTDNYFPSNLNIKNRALILKLTYWFNL